MWRIVARQRSRASATAQCFRSAGVRQKHIPTAASTSVKRVVPPATKRSSDKKSDSQDKIEVVDPITLSGSNEPLFRLPLINIGDYVEAFRYVFI